MPPKGLRPAWAGDSGPQEKILRTVTNAVERCPVCLLSGEMGHGRHLPFVAFVFLLECVYQLKEEPL